MTTPAEQPHYDVATTTSNTGEKYEDLDGFQQQYVPTGVGIAFDGPGGGGSRRDTMRTRPPPVENRMYETMYAEPNMMSERVVDEPAVVVPASAPTRESRVWKLGVSVALVVVAVLGVAAVVMSRGESDSDGSSTPLGGTAAPLVGDSGLASRVASLESMLNRSVDRIAALEADVAAKDTRIATLEEDGAAKDTQIAGLSQSLTQALVRTSALEVEVVSLRGVTVTPPVDDSLANRVAALETAFGNQSFGERLDEVESQVAFINYSFNASDASPMLETRIIFENNDANASIVQLGCDRSEILIDVHCDCGIRVTACDSQTYTEGCYNSDNSTLNCGNGNAHYNSAHSHGGVCRQFRHREAAIVEFSDDRRSATCTCEGSIVQVGTALCLSGSSSVVNNPSSTVDPNHLVQLESSLLGNVSLLRTEFDYQIGTLNVLVNQTTTQVSSFSNAIDSLQNASESWSSDRMWTFGNGVIASSVTLIGGLSLADHALLSGLIPHNIQRITGYLQIDRNDNLEDISEMNSLNNIGENLQIHSNANLAQISGMTSLTTVGSLLSINDNNNLADISGMNNLTTIGHRLQIYSNSNLVDISGMNSLATIFDDLYVHNNGNLVNISGMNDLTTIGANLRITNNLNLVDMSGLENLRRVEGYIHINNNGNVNYEPLRNLVCHGGVMNSNPSIYCNGCPSWLINKPRC